jgi:hypothetical protein
MEGFGRRKVTRDPAAGGGANDRIAYQAVSPVACDRRPSEDILMRTVLAGCVAIVLSMQSLTVAAVVGERKKPQEDLAGDQAKEHRELIRQGSHAYTIEFEETVDGTMTRMPVAYGAFKQGWQPNRSVAIENIGQTDVVNPRIVVGGKRNWRTLADIVAEAVGDYTDPADRARAIWENERRTRFHACTWDKECNDAVKVRNVYGYTLCGNEAQVVNDLWKAAGLVTRRGYPIGHCVTEVLYGGGYHLLDGDEHVICLKRDNRTIASCEEIVRDHDLVKRTHTYGILQRDSRQTDESSASLYWYQGKREGDWGDNTTHTMDLTLRPRESIELRWDHAGKEYSAGTPTKPGEEDRDGNGTLVRWGPTAYEKICNGKLLYRPDLAQPITPQGADNVDNARFDTVSASIKPIDPATPATVTWQMAAPWVFVGGQATARLELADGASAQWQFSLDQKNWSSLAAAAGPKPSQLRAGLDDVVSPRLKPTYRYWIRLVLQGDAAASNVSLENDVQTSTLSLPELEVGQNRIEYADETQGPRMVRVTHQWVERTIWHPPQPPAEAISPENGTTVSGSGVQFRWTESVDPDGDAIADYHFELSEHADMRWPLSPNFEKLISNTPSRGKPQWKVPGVGLLNPDTTYYWRVRAQDARNVWGPWSKTFDFRIKAPGVPLDVKLAADGQYGFRLQWQASPQGQPPVKYKVYGSDEKGFAVADAEYLVNMGRGFVRDIGQYDGKPQDAPDVGMVKTPANLIALLEATSLAVVGPEATGTNTNRAFYRVVAVDAAGNESGPSDYAEVPRPFIFTPPDLQARVGRPYEYQPGVIRSIGDLQCRSSPKSSYNAAYWDRQEYTFTAVQLPDGLSLDAPSGRISGKPAKPGTFDVAFTVADQFGASGEFSYRLTVADDQ